MRPLRIAFLDSWLQSALEGSGTAVGIGGLADALRRDGHTIDRIAPPQTARWQRLSITARRLLFNLVLPSRFDADSYDLIVGFDIDGVTLPRAKRPYICSIKGVIAEELLHERGRIRALFTFLAKLEGANARRANRVVSTSAYCRDRIAHHYHVPRERIGIVPEGIDLATWRAALAQAPLRMDQRPTVLCVARQYPRKHVADLLRAFALIAHRAPDARLRLVGDGPEHSNLVALSYELGINARVAFLGGIPDADVKREYAHADVFCLPSVQEGFGIVFLEAMAAGLPVIATNATAIPEVVRHGATGILVQPGDVHSLAGALLVLLTDHARRAAYGQMARTVVTHYDWERVSATFLYEARHILH